MNKAILNADVQRFINNHLNDDIAKIALSKSPFPEVSPAELAEQIDSKKRSQKKLPTWFNADNIYYPPKLSIEQTSSELTAKYKASLVSAETVADLTGGFGVDSYYFARYASQVSHFELDKNLSKIAQHNATELGIDNIVFSQGDGVRSVLQSENTFDVIYIDPSRRIKSHKVFFLKDCEPEVVSNLDKLLEKSPIIIIKTSPLLDISSGLRELTQVSQIHVLSVKNDCKELLWIIQRGYVGEPQIICAALGNAQPVSFDFFQSEERSIQLENYSLPLKYIYEPDVALLKAGAFKIITQRFSLSKLDKNSHLYTSAELLINFPGRVFAVNNVVDYKTFNMKPTLKKANFVSRNFPLSTAELKKKHKLEDGGEDFLFFTKVNEEQLKVISATRAMG